MDPPPPQGCLRMLRIYTELTVKLRMYVYMQTVERVLAYAEILYSKLLQGTFSEFENTLYFSN